MTETLPFDAAEHLTSPEAQAELLADAVESGNAGYLATALGTIARARGMTSVAKKPASPARRSTRLCRLTAIRGSALSSASSEPSA